MGSFQDNFGHIGERLRSLSSGQRLAVGSVAIIVVMSLLLVSIYAARPSMTPLGLNASMADADMTRAISWLETRGIPYRNVEGDIHVPPGKKYTILNELQERDLIGPEQIDFDALVHEDSPFLSRAQNRTRFRIAKMNVLARMIGEMSGVERATVVIDEPEGTPAIGRPRVAASASVTVMPSDRSLSTDQIDAIAHLVSGSHAGLDVENVQVIDARTSQVHQARGAGTASPDEHLELKIAAEERVRDKITQALGYIDGVGVSVNVMIDGRRIKEHRRSVDEPRVAVTNESTRERVMTPGDAIASSNTPVSLTADAADSVATELETETTMTSRFGGRESHIEDAGGYARQINASIRVPRSHFVRVYRQQVGDPTALPDVAVLDSLVSRETEEIRAQVEPLIDTSANDGAMPGQVVVKMVPDAAPLDPATAGEEAGTTSLAAWLDDDAMVQWVVVGAIGLLSLFIMVSMVRRATRRATPAPPIPASEVDRDWMSSADPAQRRRLLADRANMAAADAPHEAAQVIRRWMRAGASS